PRSRVTSFTRLLRNSPDATRSTSESATCDATIHFPLRNSTRFELPAAAPLIEDDTAGRVARNAGTTPNNKPVRTPRTHVQPKIRRPEAKPRNTVSQLLNKNSKSPSAPHRAKKKPSSAPADDRRMPSVNTCGPSR